MRLYDNKWWRMNNIYWIIDKDGNRVRFRCNDAQIWFYRAMWFLNIILKSRQLGFTTFVAICYLDDCIFTNNLEAGIIAHNREDAQKIFRRKIQYPYKNLPDWIKRQRPLTTDSRQELAFNNNSIIYVATSLRSGTVQRLLVSEHGKICRKYPDKAEEIKSGTLNAIHPGNIVVIESTAEGRYGDFYDWCQKAMNKFLEGRQLTRLDFKFHFFPWWIDPKCHVDDDDVKIVTITKEMAEYFDELEEEINRDKILGYMAPSLPFKLTPNQKAWYVLKEEQQGEKMLQEYPSTPKEAFDAQIKGAYYAKAMLWLRKQRPLRITTVPYDPRLPVDFGFDLGDDDYTAITVRQRYQWENRIINFYQNRQEDVSHYVQWMQDQNYAIWGTVFLPHDSKSRSMRLGRRRIFDDFRLLIPDSVNIDVVPRPESLQDVHHSVRMLLRSTWIDSQNCQELIDCLDNYCQAWDDKTGQFKSTYADNGYQHGADSLGVIAYREDPDHGALSKHRDNFRDLRRRKGGRAR